MRRRADQRRGHQSEQRQRREPPADVGRVDERVAIPACGGELLERGAGIGDGDELPARLVAERRGQPLPEEALHRRDFDRAAALAGDDEPAVRSGSIRAAACVMVRSSVVSSTNSSGEPGVRRRRPSAALRRRGCCRPCRAGRPSRTPSSRAAWPSAARRSRCGRMVVPTSSQPSRDAIDLAAAEPGLGLPDRDVALPDARDDVIVKQSCWRARRRVRKEAS